MQIFIMSYIYFHTNKTVILFYTYTRQIFISVHKLYHQNLKLSIYTPTSILDPTDLPHSTTPGAAPAKRSRLLQWSRLPERSQMTCRRDHLSGATSLPLLLKNSLWMQILRTDCAKTNPYRNA